jgi:hypothetical protein
MTLNRLRRTLKDMQKQTRTLVHKQGQRKPSEIDTQFLLVEPVLEMAG